MQPCDEQDHPVEVADQVVQEGLEAQGHREEP
jgi:hypothetical protein